MSRPTPSQDCPKCGRFVQDRPNVGLRCSCGWSLSRHDTAADDPTGQVPPFRDDVDPDEFHRRIREQSEQGMHHHRLVAGGYGLEPGDMVMLQRHVYRVERVTRWTNNAGHDVDLDPITDTSPGQARIPWTYSGGRPLGGAPYERVTDPHFPVCHDCGEAWPCTSDSQRLQAKVATDRAVAVFEDEAAHPWVCPWHARFSTWRLSGGRGRYKTERGLKQHIAKCKANPANWQLDEWVPLIDDQLRIAGGCARHIATNQRFRLAEEVQRRALDGTLPDSLYDLPDHFHQ